MDRIYLALYYISIFGGIILAAVGVGFFLRNRKSAEDQAQAPAWEGEVSRIAVLLLFLVAFLLRLYGLGSTPQGINQDEAMSVVNARSILETGMDIAGNSYPAEFVAWGNSGQSVLLAYCMIPLIALFGDGLFVVRLVPVLFSMLGLWAFYQLCRQMVSAKKAYILTLFAAFSPWHFMQSRWGLDCNLMSHLWILGILMLLMALKDRRFYYGAAAVFGLSMYSYGISFYTITVYLVIGVLYLLYTKQISVKQTLGCMGIFLLISLPIDLTMLINTLHLETMHFGPITMPLLSDQVRSQDILLFAFSGEQMLTNLRFLERLLLGQYDGLWFNSNLFFGTIYLCSMPFALIGMIKICYEAHKNAALIVRTKWMLIWLYLVIAFFSGVITKEVNVNRMNFLYYGLIFATGVGFFTLGEGLGNWRKSVYVLYSINIVAFFFMYFTLWANTSSFFADYEQAIKAAGETGKDRQAIVVEYNSPDMTKVLTLYEQAVPMETYQNGTFAENVTFYEKIEDIDTMQEEVVYVIRLSDLELLPEDFVVMQYGAYAVVYQ
ncbi:MAG: glycosyltransferase family 39 protein [Lachnospiraceae bacterium]|nr:glycosyltransferase family 39 protein [Lachnospiraceae bacterium]